MYLEGRSLRRSCIIGRQGRGVQKHCTYIYDWKSRGWILTGGSGRQRGGCSLRVYRGNAETAWVHIWRVLGRGGEGIFYVCIYFLPHTSTCIYRLHTKQFLPPHWKYPPFSLPPTAPFYDFIHWTLVFYILRCISKIFEWGCLRCRDSKEALPT